MIFEKVIHIQWEHLILSIACDGINFDAAFFYLKDRVASLLTVPQILPIMHIAIPENTALAACLCSLALSLNQHWHFCIVLPSLKSTDRLEQPPAHEG